MLTFYPDLFWQQGLTGLLAIWRRRMNFLEASVLYRRLPGNIGAYN